MLPREKPSTRKVPISRARRATAAYMVFIAAKATADRHDDRHEDSEKLDGRGGDHLVVVVFLFCDRVDIEPLVRLDVVDERLDRGAVDGANQSGTEDFTAVVVRCGLVQVTQSSLLIADEPWLMTPTISQSPLPN